MNLKSLYAINVGALLLVILTGIYFTFLEGPILSYENLPFIPIESSVRPGQIVHLYVRRCSTARQTRNYIISHELVGGPKPILMKTETASIRPGCHDEVSPINEIPSGLPISDMPTGTYHVEGGSEVQGTFRTFIVPWRSLPFEIVR